MTTLALMQERTDPSPRLAGTVALVTGGGLGLGRHLAEALAGAGAAVGILGRTGAALEETETAIRGAGLGPVASAVADVTDARALDEAVARIADRLGPVDVLVNNAGIGGPIGPAWEVDPEDWWRTMEVNVGGVVACSRLVLPGMVARGRGRVLNITSEAGVFRWPLFSAYAVSKAAVVRYSENLAAEVRRHGLAVFSVHPGLLPIGLSGLALASAAAPGSLEHAAFGWVRRQLADGRGVDPSEAGRLVVRLAAGEADALSGRHLSVHDDLDALIASADRVAAEDLYTLRVRRLPEQ